MPYWPSSRPLAPSASPTTSQTVTGIVDQDVGDREDEVGPGPLVEPEEGEQVLEHREDPEADDRDPHQVRRPSVEQEPRDRLGEGQGDQRRPIVVVQSSDAKAVFTTWFGVLAGLVVEAQQRLDHPEPDDDAGRDHRRRTAPRPRRSRRGVR